MPHEQPYPAHVLEFRERTSSRDLGRPRRRAARRALVVSALLALTLAPLHGADTGANAASVPSSMRVASERPAAGARAEAKPAQVALKLKKKRVTSEQRARVKVVVRPRASESAGDRALQLQSLRTGQVKIVVKGGGHRRIVRAQLVDRKLRASLPKLTVGIYRVRAVFLGNRVLQRSASRSKALTVVASGSATPPSGFPNASNTGVPSDVTLSPYSGPCTITSDGTVIDSKNVTCDLTVRAKDVVIKNSSLKTIWLDQDLMHSQGKSGWSVRVTDSELDAGTRDGPGVCCGNYAVLRVEMKGGHNGAQCENDADYCKLTDSWIHGQYEPAGGQRHLGGFLNDGGTPSTLIHNSITCDAPAENDEGGCTGDINLIPNFGVMADVLVQGNYLGANANSAYCTYAGATPGSTSYARQSNHIVYLDNVFERVDTIVDPAPGQPASTKRCAAYGPVVGFDADGPGNVWSGNRYDDGTAILCDKAHRCD